MSKWISVDDRLPEGGCDSLLEGIEDVLIAYKRVCPCCANAVGTHIYVGYYIYGDWLLAEPLNDDIFDKKHHCQIEVTHWMLLPELPE